jgi:hypothetical protein
MDACDQIWNRANDYDAQGRLPEGLRKGDRALADVMLLHGMACNGGLLHAVEGLSDEERAAAVEGFRWLGLTQAADSVELVAVRRAELDEADDDAAGGLEESANTLYAAAVPDDTTLQTALRLRYDTSPEDFAPLP